MGVIYTYRNQLNKAITYLDSSMVIYRELKDSFNLGNVFISIGDAYLENRQNLDSARYHLLNGYEIMRHYDDNNHQSKALLYLGKLENLTNHYARAHSYLSEGLKVLEGSELDETRRDLYRALAFSGFKMGRFAEAYDHLNQSYDLNDTIRSQERLKYTEEMQAKYETEKKDRAIVELNAQQTIDQLRLSNAQRTTAILTITLMVFGLLIFGLYQLYQKIKAPAKPDFTNAF